MPRTRPGGGYPRKMQRHRHWKDSLQAIMEPAGAVQSAQTVDVGGRLRELRTTRGLSIRSLAEMSGLNFNTLSLIENEKSSPSVSTLQQLAQALQIPIAAFFETSVAPQEVIFQRAGKRPRATFSHGSLEDMGSGLTLGEGIPLLLTLQPGADSGPDAVVHTGQEFVYCLDGCLEYMVAGEAYDLGPGDSLIFHSHLPHRWENRGASSTRFILILCPSDENDRSTEQHFKPAQAER